MAATETQQPTAPWRTPRELRVALYALFGLIGTVLVLCGALSLLDLAANKTTVDVRTYRGVQALVIDDASNVELTSAPPGGELRVRSRTTEGLGTPDRHVDQRDGALILSSSCGFFFGRCNVDYEIAVPAGTSVRVDATAGDVRAEALRSTVPVELESSAGDVTATDVTAPELRISSSAGDVEARGVRADRVSAESSAGDVVLSLRAVPRRVDANSSAGDVQIVLPDEVYAVDASSSAGDVDTREIQNDPASSRIVNARSSAGDVQIEARR
jgi:Putative adhesin